MTNPGTAYRLDVEPQGAQRPGGARRAYIPAFDGIRALAAMGVLANHALTYTNTPFSQFTRRGWYGVDVFFVLSGFLITWILIGEQESTGTISLKRFYVRRALRLQPAYFSFLMLSILALAIGKQSELRDMIRELPLFITYTINLARAWALVPNVASFGIAWSLCIEEQFYAFWAPVLKRLGSGRALKLAVGLVVAVALYRSALYMRLNWGHLSAMSGASFQRIYLAPDTRMDTCMTGCALALALNRKSLDWLWSYLTRARWFPTVTAVTLPIVVFYITGAEPSGGCRAWTLGATVGAIAVAAFIAAVFLHPQSWVSRFLSLGPLVFVGKVSYGVYLFHVLVVVCIHRALGLHQVDSASLMSEMTVLVLAAAGSILVAWVHYRAVERFFLAFRPG